MGTITKQPWVQSLNSHGYNH